jgi:hypothetical protein
MLADLQLMNTVSRINDTGAVIAYGKGVVTDATVVGDTPGMKLPVGDETDDLTFNGVVMYEINRAQADGDIAGATDNQLGTVITEGVVWVVATETVAVDEPVWLRVGATNKGDFTNAVGTGVTLSVALHNAKFLTAGVSGDLVKIALGLGG